MFNVAASDDQTIELDFTKRVLGFGRGNGGLLRERYYGARYGVISSWEPIIDHEPK